MKIAIPSRRAFIVIKRKGAITTVLIISRLLLFHRSTVD